MIRTDSRIRTGAPADAAALGRIYVETWRAAYPAILPGHVLTTMSEARQTAYWRRAIKHAGRTGFVLVAETDADGVIGFASAGAARAAAGSYRGEVYTLYVAQDHQGLGFGRALLTATLRRLREAGFAPVLIWVLADNPARFFYEAMGGLRVAEREDALGGLRHRELGYGWADPTTPHGR